MVSLPAVQPGSLFSPNQYSVPSVVVSFQCSPSLSPLSAPVSLAIFAPFSEARCHSLVLSSWISSPDMPLSTIVALSKAQHCSADVFWPSSAQDL